MDAGRHERVLKEHLVGQAAGFVSWDYMYESIGIGGADGLMWDSMDAGTPSKSLESWSGLVWVGLVIPESSWHHLR